MEVGRTQSEVDGRNDAVADGDCGCGRRDCGYERERGSGCENGGEVGSETVSVAAWRDVAVGHECGRS